MEYAYHVISGEHGAYSPQELDEIIRSHRTAIENGSRHRRDVILGEDASRIAKDEERNNAHVMAALRNLVLAFFEGKSTVAKCKDACLVGGARWTASRP